MKIASSWSVDQESRQAAVEAYNMILKKLLAPPQFMIVHSSCEYDNKEIIKQLRLLSSNTPIQGGTSCFGVMTENGFHTRNNKGLGILGICDPEGSYGVGIADSKNSPEKAAIRALDQALIQAKRPGEVPIVIIISIHPGYEDQVIRTIEEHVGSNVPIIGGTSADNDMTGQWKQFANDTVASEAISIAAIFPSADIGYAFHSGYEPTNHAGIVTRADGRILYEIDHKPAALVYNNWTKGIANNILRYGGSLVPAATFSPLGNQVVQIGGIPYYRLAYPTEVLENKALKLFAEVVEGSDVVLMKGTHDSLSTRCGRVASVAIESAPFKAEEVQGALVLFCTGCMLAIQDRMSESVTGLNSILKDAPFLCAFTLGEQGCFLGGENRHGNLMIAVLTFGLTKLEQ